MQVKPVEIATPDGVADGYAVFPREDGQYPGVIMYMDAIGLRPVLLEQARKVAERGYYVLVPNLFYRSGHAPVIDYQTMLAGGEESAGIRAHMMALVGGLTPDQVERDSGAYLDFLDAQPQVRAGMRASTGYCMGGAVSLRTAAYHPGRIAAAASFHGGKLATEAPASPHHLVGQIKAELYIGHASNDPSAPPEQIERLEAALNAAGVRHLTERYDAAHGWTMPDLAWAYDPACAEKAWGRLFELLDRALRNG